MSDPKHYKALGGVALSKIIAKATYWHEARYLPFLVTYAETWESAEQPDEPDDDTGNVITLADIGLIDIIPAAGLPAFNGDGPEEPHDDLLDDE